MFVCLQREFLSGEPRAECVAAPRGWQWAGAANEWGPRGGYSDKREDWGEKGLLELGESRRHVALEDFGEVVGPGPWLQCPGWPSLTPLCP